ncbi:MAG: hypothetical protein ABMA64_39525, partial [Myxococcota bacterium]
MIERLIDLTLYAGMVGLWLIAVIVAVWQILRGRALAGAALGLAGVVGLATTLGSGLIGAAFQLVATAAGAVVAQLGSALCFGLADALIVALLVTAAAVQRPPP